MTCIYTYTGMKPQGAVLLFIVGAIATVLYNMIQPSLKARIAEMPAGSRRTLRVAALAVAFVLFALFPLYAGNFVGQVFLLVGLFMLMGMGLNLEVGLAGLLDLGFVAFYAVGAYVTALLTANDPHALAQLTWWEAMPIAVLCSVIVGVLFGVPVLKVRGDYLAVATMGLGEIVRVIVLSDAAAPLLAGAKGILQHSAAGFLRPRAQHAGAAVLSDAGLLAGRRLCRLAARGFAPRPGLDGDPRRRGRGAGARHQPDQCQAAGLWAGGGVCRPRRLDLRHHARLDLSRTASSSSSRSTSWRSSSSAAWAACQAWRSGRWC